MKSMKGFVSISEASILAIAFVVFIVVLAVGGQILAGIQTTQTAGTTAYSATGYGLSGILNVSQQTPTIGVVIGAVIILGLLLGAFMIKKE
jgi:hypothetical protein